MSRRSISRPRRAGGTRLKPGTTDPEPDTPRPRRAGKVTLPAVADLRHLAAAAPSGRWTAGSRAAAAAEDTGVAASAGETLIICNH